MKTALVAAGILLTGLVLVAETGMEYWPQWRGPGGSGVALGNPPVEWSEDKNIRWKTSIPGKGLATPIIWKDRVYVLTAVRADGNAGGEKTEDKDWMKEIKPDRVLNFDIIAFNRADGSVVWRKTARSTKPHEGTHETASWASNSGVTDGEHLYAYFGSNGIYCYDMAGVLKWEKDLGDMTTRNSFGEGSSPALHGNTIVLNWDHEGPSFIVALDKNTGEEKWRAERDEPTSWSTPLIVEVDGFPQVIVNATNRVRGYDLETGDVIWECGGMTLNAVPSPVYANGLIYVASGFRGNAMLAIRLKDAKGDITGSDAVVWSHDEDTPYVPSPVVYNNRIYFLKRNSEILSCLDAGTGAPLYGQKRLTGIQGVYASPVAAAGRVYFTGRNGVSVVVRDGNEFDVLATNELDDRFDASPAVVGNELYLRGRQYLYCIAED